MASTPDKGGGMSTTRKEIDKFLQSMTEQDLRLVRSFVKMLLQKPDELTEEELKDVRKGEVEFRRGEWVNWEDVRRRDV
jgi:hypothetical protein